jgi:hypothetical protein
MRIRFMVLAAAAAVAVAACDEKLSSLTGPTPNLQPTFSSIQHEIFDTTDAAGRQACTNCHTNAGGRNPSGGLNLVSGVSYNNLVGVVSPRRGLPRVAPGDPENSYIIHKLEGRAGIGGVRMPLTGTPLTDGQILVIKRWIELGAPNN